MLSKCIAAIWEIHPDTGNSSNMNWKYDMKVFFFYYYLKISLKLKLQTSQYPLSEYTRSVLIRNPVLVLVKTRWALGTATALVLETFLWDFGPCWCHIMLYISCSVSWIRWPWRPLKYHRSETDWDDMAHYPAGCSRYTVMSIGHKRMHWVSSHTDWITVWMDRCS